MPNLLLIQEILRVNQMVLESEGGETAAGEWGGSVEAAAEEWGGSGAGLARCLAVNEKTRYGDVFLFRDGSLVCKVVGVEVYRRRLLSVRSAAVSY